MRRKQNGLKILVSDCEGPISKNDNAFEITSHFIPNGDFFFSLLSKYDDAIADLVKRPRYRAGYTLKLILPFLKAYGVTDKMVEEYSTENILLLHGAKEMLHKVKEKMPTFIVSTSYQQYLSSLCTLIDFPYENVYCTKLNLDKYHIDITETERLKTLRAEIQELPMIHIPKNVDSIIQLSTENQETVKILDSIFFKEIPQMVIGQLLEDVNPIGGEEKAESVRDIVKKTGSNLSDVMYVGDSITDVQAFQLVREGRGLTISFNGNAYAVKNAEIAVLSENAIITSILAEVFFNSGRDHTLKLVEEWSFKSLKKYCSKETIHMLSQTYPRNLPSVRLIKRDNIDKLAEESSLFRKTVRGEAIGRLG